MRTAVSHRPVANTPPSPGSLEAQELWIEGMNERALHRGLRHSPRARLYYRLRASKLAKQVKALTTKSGD